MNKFKIALDISPLNDGNAVRGVGYYTKHLLSALELELKNNSDYRHFSLDFVEKKTDLTKFDLVHYPFFDPFVLTLPQKQIPSIVTIHDLMPRQFKAHFPVGFKGEIKWLIQRARARQSDYILTVSHYSKYVISDLLHYPVDKVFVAYEAADASFKPISDKKLLASIKNKYHLPDKFVLFVGDINWNKNIPGIVKSCLKLNIPLVIVGSAATKKVVDHPWTKDILWLQSQKSPLITCTGFVPDNELPAIFNLATIYCQPSFAEGFGLPILQAMQSGCPTIYSQETSLPEIADFNGEFFDPYQPESLDKVLTQLWSDEELRQEYSRLGLARAKTFTWQQTALGTLAVYQLVYLQNAI